MVYQTCPPRSSVALRTRISLPLAPIVACWVALRETYVTPSSSSLPPVYVHPFPAVNLPVPILTNLTLPAIATFVFAVSVTLLTHSVERVPELSFLIVALFGDSSPATVRLCPSRFSDAFDEKETVVPSPRQSQSIARAEFAMARLKYVSVCPRGTLNVVVPDTVIAVFASGILPSSTVPE